MRTRVLAVLGIFFAGTLVVQGAGQHWKCQGNHNCASTTCVDSGINYSCAEVTPVNHPKCEYTGNSADNCTITQRACLKREYYAGGTCYGDPKRCPHDFPYNLSDYLCEDGCGTNPHACAGS